MGHSLQVKLWCHVPTLELMLWYTGAMHASCGDPLLNKRTVSCCLPPHQSDIVRVDTTKQPPVIAGRLEGVGNKAHGLVPWRGHLIMLDSDNGALMAVTPGDTTHPGGAPTARRLWKAPEPKRFLKVGSRQLFFLLIIMCSGGGWVQGMLLLLAESAGTADIGSQPHQMGPWMAAASPVTSTQTHQPCPTNTLAISDSRRTRQIPSTSPPNPQTPNPTPPCLL
jgi:hypothetical protein